MEDAVREYRYAVALDEQIYGQAYQCPSEALGSRRRRDGSFRMGWGIGRYKSPSQLSQAI